MRKIKFIVLHCTAGGAQQKTEDIKSYWKRVLGWKSYGYHKLINADGSVETLANDDIIVNGVKGFNHNSINICYKGGYNGLDTRTKEQKESLLKLVKEYKQKYPRATVLGHRDLSKDLDGDGVIEPHEYQKLCPCYNVQEEYKNI